MRLSQEIDLSGSRSLRRDGGDLAVAQAELNVRAAELLLRRDIRVAFAGLSAAEDHLASLAGLLALARRLDSLAERELVVGMLIFLLMATMSFLLTTRR